VTYKSFFQISTATIIIAVVNHEQNGDLLPVYYAVRRIERCISACSERESHRGVPELRQDDLRQQYAKITFEGEAS